MASVSKRVRDGNTTYWVRWRDPEGNQKSKTFTKKTGPGGADEFRAELETKLNRGTYFDSSRGNISTEEWAETWFSGQSHLKESTRARYRGLLDTHILKKWSKTPINKISHADVVTWVNAMTASGSSPSTVRQAHRVLSLMLSLAIRDERLTRNVANDVKLPRQIAIEPVFLDPAELALLVKAAGSRGLDIKTLGLTGLRFGEFAALDEKFFDRDKRRIKIVKNVTEVKGTLVWGTPKTGESRTVPIPKTLSEEINAYIGNRKGLAFVTRYGHALRLNNWRRDVFDPAAEACGFDITPHDLRHTAASLAISKGANIKAVQSMLGHARASMTLDIYAGLFPDDLDAVAEAMDSIDVPLYSDDPQSESTPEQSHEVEQQD